MHCHSNQLRLFARNCPGSQHGGCALADCTQLCALSRLELAVDAWLEPDERNKQ